MPRVAILLSGQSRTNGLSLNPTKHTTILNSWDKYIFTDEFKAAYDYDIYITSDTLDVSASLDYFGPERVKNIHLLDTNYYMKPVTAIPPISEYLQAYTVPQGFVPHTKLVNQLYKMFDCFNLMKEDGLSYDYIVRLRFDVVLHHNIMDCLEKLNSVEMINYSEIFFLGKYDCMCWAFQLLLHNGSYNPYGTGHYILGWGKDSTLSSDSHRWAYSHEAQASEHMYNYYEERTTLVDVAVSHMDLCRIMRSDGRLENW
jgi:hypothetical protein